MNKGGGGGGGQAPSSGGHVLLLLQPAAWGTLGTLRTFLSFSVDKDVQRLLKAITGQGKLMPLLCRVRLSLLIDIYL